MAGWPQLLNIEAINGVSSRYYWLHPIKKVSTPVKVEPQNLRCMGEKRKSFEGYFYIFFIIYDKFILIKIVVFYIIYFLLIILIKNK